MIFPVRAQVKKVLPIAFMLFRTGDGNPSKQLSFAERMQLTIPAPEISRDSPWRQNSCHPQRRRYSLPCRKSPLLLRRWKLSGARWNILGIVFLIGGHRCFAPANHLLKLPLNRRIFITSSFDCFGSLAEQPKSKKIVEGVRPEPQETPKSTRSTAGQLMDLDSVWAALSSLQLADIETDASSTLERRFYL